MPKVNSLLNAFNRGIISETALARVDVERIRLSASVMTNWMPKTQGPMRLRAGTAYLGSSLSDSKAKWIDFVAATDNTALLEITDLRMRIWINDAPISRPSVSTTISNSSFATSTSWTDSSTGGGTLTFGGTGLVLNAINRGGTAICTRQITVGGPDQNIEHSLAINVTRGPVTFRCGSSSGGDQYVTETSLGTGRHSLSFTPTGDFYLQISSDLQIDKIVASLAIETSGVVMLIAPWAEADLSKLRWAQSADVIFVACEGYRQKRIERRGDGRSWSIIEYVVDDGPFQAIANAKVKLKPSVTFGNGTLTSDKKFFRQSHVGAIFRLFHSGYHGTFYLGAEDTFTNPIRVTGVHTDNYDDRNFTHTVSGTWTGTLTTRRSFDDKDTGYTDFRYDKNHATFPITANGAYVNTDADSNSIVYYIMGFKPGDFTSGAAHIVQSYDGGGDFGICRVTGYTSATQVDIEVLKDFTDVQFTDDWREGLWSDHLGFPTAVGFYEGRIWWAGNVYIFGSVSDAYDSYDAETLGDAGPIVRTIASGPVDVVNWILPLQRLLLGTAGTEISLKSSSFDEPLTPQAFGARDAETEGSAKMAAAKIGKRGVFVQRSLKRVFELVYAGNTLDYDVKELTLLCPDITGTANISGIAVQRQPDTRLHFWLDDGTVLICTYEPIEDVLCWSRVTTLGSVEQIVVLPSTEEDRVYYHINRTINGTTKRFLEKWALESECKGGTTNKQLDCFVSLTLSAPVTTIAVGTQLRGKSVAVWAGGKCLVDVNGDIATFTVDASGNIAIPSNSATQYIVGLQYTATYKSSKLAYGAAGGTALTMDKRVCQVGLILGTMHHKGLETGYDFDHMDPLPAIKDGAVVAVDTVFTEYDQHPHAVPATWDTDSRLCLRATAPRVAEVNACIISVQTNG